MEFTKRTLKNGLTLITIPKKSATTAAVFTTEAGSIFDFRGKEGIAHLLEHMAFKGTRKFKDAHAVVEASEGIGGEVNAGTGKESMSFHIETPHEKIAQGLEWVSEVSLYPTFPVEPFERERNVVIEEARMYFDKHERYSAYKAIYNLFGDSVWGIPIEGYEKTINAIAHKDLQKFHDTVFTPEKSVLVVCGQFNETSIVKIVGQLFGDSFGKTAGTKTKQKIDRKHIEPRFKVKPLQPKGPFNEKRKVKQVYLSIAFPGPNENDPAYYDFLIANAVLGSGMGSKLFKEVREKSGLCYYISSGLAAYKRSGFALIVSGLNVKQLKKASTEIKREINTLRAGVISKEELSRAKLLTKTSVLSSYNNPLDIAASVGDYFLNSGKIITPEELAKKIDAVTIRRAARSAGELFDLARASIAIVSPSANLTGDLLPLKE